MISDEESHTQDGSPRDHLTLGEQLEATREAVQELSIAVVNLTRREKRNRAWTVMLSIVAVALIGLGGFVWIDAKNSDRELRNLGESLFLFSCSVSNDSREALREDNVADAEALILVTQAEQNDPEAAQQYRDITRENNENITPRNCQEELNAIVGF